MSLVLWLYKCAIVEFDLHKTLLSRHHFINEKNEIFKTVWSWMHIITWEVTLSSRIVRTSWQKTRPCVRKKEVKEERKEEKGGGGTARNRPNHMHTTVTGDIHACIHQALIYTLKHCSSELTLIKDSRSNFPLFFLKEITSVAERISQASREWGSSFIFWALLKTQGNIWLFQWQIIVYSFSDVYNNFWQANSFLFIYL